MPDFVPRSGRQAVDGLVWLGRLLDKLRASETGAHGDYYVLEQSFMDRVVLKAWGIQPDQVRQWVREGLDDEAIARRVCETNGWDRARRESWSRGFLRGIGLVTLAMDADEGHMAPGPAAAFWRGVMGIIKRVV